MTKGRYDMGAGEKDFVLVDRGGTRRVGAMQSLYIYNNI